MATNTAKPQTAAMKAAASKRFEALLDKRATQLGKQLEGHAHVNLRENVPMQVLSGEFEKSRRRQLN